MYNVQINEIISKKIYLDEGNCVHKDSIRFFKNFSNISIFAACSQMPSQI